MTKITIRTDVLRGIITLEGSLTNPNLYIVRGARYVPFELTADSLSDAVSNLLNNLHALKVSPEVAARNKARGTNLRKNGQQNSKPAKPDQQPTLRVAIK